MTLMRLCRSQHRVFIFAGTLGLAVLTAPLFSGLAQAFTIDDQSNTNSNGSAKFSDPDARLTGKDNNGTTVYRQGNMSLQLGSPQRGSTDTRYNTDRIFNPNGRPGDER
jgi:hypothetical protein